MSGSDVGSEPLVSVVLPTHDRPALVQAAAESVAAQTHGNIELLIVDDCSPTPVAESLDTEAIESTVSLSVLRHETNRGANVARNTGIRAANGAFIAFLDDDDRWEPEKIARQVEAFAEGGPEIGVVCVGQRFVDETGQFTQHRKPNASGEVTEAIFRGAILGPFSTIMVRSSVVEKAGLPDVRFPAWQDREWHIRLSQHCEYVTLTEGLTIRRVGDHHQIGNDYEAQREAASLYLGKHRSLAAEFGENVARMAAADAYGGVASVALVAGEYRECRRYALRALRNDLRSPKCYVYLAIGIGGDPVLSFVRRIRRAYHRMADRLVQS